MEPEKIRVLLATTPDKLEAVAKRMSLPLPIARDIRVQAMNLVLGKCCLCSKLTLAGMCKHCKKNAPHRRMIPWSSVKLLQKLKPSDQLLRQTCDSCGGPFMLSASYLLRKLLSKHSDEVKKTCNTCVERAQEAVRRLEAEKKAEENRKAYEERKKRREDAARREAHQQEVAAARAPHLLHKPFAGNEQLEKLRKELPKAPRRQDHRRKAKRG